MASQAKCESCQIHAIYPRRLQKPLGRLRCPRCGGPVKATSRLLTWPKISV